MHRKVTAISTKVRPKSLCWIPTNRSPPSKTPYSPCRSGLTEKQNESVRAHPHVFSHFLQPQVHGQICLDVFNCLAQPQRRHTSSDFAYFCRPHAEMPGQISRE